MVIKSQNKKVLNLIDFLKLFHQKGLRIRNALTVR